MNELTDFIAGLLIQVGSYYKIRKNKFGWVISMCCIIYWMARGLSLGLQAQSFWHVFSLCTAAYGFYTWNKDDSDCLEGGNAEKPPQKLSPEIQKYFEFRLLGYGKKETKRD